MAISKISMHRDNYALEQIKSVLTNVDVWDPSVKIERSDRGIRKRGLDLAVVIALVGTTGTVVGALIAGFFQLVSARKNGKIVLSSKGKSIEFPADLPSEEVDKMIDKLKQLEYEECEIFLF